MEQVKRVLVKSNESMLCCLLSLLQCLVESWPLYGGSKERPSLTSQLTNCYFDIQLGP